MPAPHTSGIFLLHHFFLCPAYFPSVSPYLPPWVVLFCVCELSLPPHRGFCFLSQVHVAHIQIAPGWARPPVCWAGQPALQTGLRRQDQQSAAGSGEAQQAAVSGAAWPAGAVMGTADLSSKDGVRSWAILAWSCQCPLWTVELRKLHRSE